MVEAALVGPHRPHWSPDLDPITRVSHQQARGEHGVMSTRMWWHLNVEIGKYQVWGNFLTRFKNKNFPILLLLWPSSFDRSKLKSLIDIIHFVKTFRKICLTIWTNKFMIEKEWEVRTDVLCGCQILLWGIWMRHLIQTSGGISIECALTVNIDVCLIWSCPEPRALMTSQRLLCSDVTNLIEFSWHLPGQREPW